MIFSNSYVPKFQCLLTSWFDDTGYKVDELNPESSHLRLQFSRFPGPRSGPGPRGKR